MSHRLRLRKLWLRNWKNFVQAEVEIEDRLFLVGPNASGKSNFLDALRFLRDLASPGGGFQQVVSRRGGVEAIRSLAARRSPDVEIGVELDEEERGVKWTYEIAFNRGPKGQPVLRKERVVRGGEVLLDRPNRDDEEDPARLGQTFLEQVTANREFREVAAFFASVRYLHVVPQIVREPDRSAGRVDDPFGGDFLEQIARTPEKTLRARLERIRDALQAAVPQLEEIGLCRDVLGRPHLRTRHRHWRPRDAWQTEEQFSDGTLRLIGLLWAVMDGEGPVLLEEPELSLHPEIVRVLPQVLARVQHRTGRQIFLSTHSPELLCDEGIGLDEVLLLTPGSEGTQVRLVTSEKEIRDLLKNAPSLADAVFAKTGPEQAKRLPLLVDSW